MPTIARHVNPTEWPSILRDSASFLQPLKRTTKEVHSQWSDRAEWLRTQTEDPELGAYEAVAPKRVYHVKANYILVGRGRPMPFDLDIE